MKVKIEEEDYYRIVNENKGLKEQLYQYENQQACECGPYNVAIDPFSYDKLKQENEKLAETNKILKSDINDLKDAIVKLVFKM